MDESRSALFGNTPIALPDGGPLYLGMVRWIEEAISSGRIGPGDALPPERELASRADVSRVTVRKAVSQLVRDGVLVQRQGSGTFVAPHAPRVEQSLRHLTSFSEDMAERGMAVSSVWLDRGRYPASADEIAILGLSAGEEVSRIARLRLSGETPLAIERASLPVELLPDPDAVGESLYAHLNASSSRPVRAVQRIRARNLGQDDADLLGVPDGMAGLFIERVSYLATGRVAELTRSIYRGDAYDFVAELTIGDP